MAYSAKTLEDHLYVGGKVDGLRKNNKIELTVQRQSLAGLHVKGHIGIAFPGFCYLPLGQINAHPKPRMQTAQKPPTTTSNLQHAGFRGNLQIVVMCQHHMIRLRRPARLSGGIVVESLQRPQLVADLR
jgi:hypothetical protein